MLQIVCLKKLQKNNDDEVNSDNDYAIHVNF